MLKDLRTFVEFLEQLRSVERAQAVLGSDPIRWENDVEHSYILAMCVWYLNQKANLGLDTDKLLRYALVHDLVEAYAGDVNVYGRKAHSGEYVEKKKQRESKAFVRIKQEFPGQTGMFDAIEAYEERNDEESKFVYSVDKLLPPLQITMDEGRSFHHFEEVLEETIETMKGRVDQHDQVAEMWQELVKEMRDQEGLFPKLSNEETLT